MHRARLAACVLAAAVAGCGGGDDRADQTATATTPSFRGLAGERVLISTGCLACHQIGERGNSGPGNNLAGIGTRRSPAQIRLALLKPKAPMPSYRQLSPPNLDALVAYLASLRGDCPEDSDCG